MNLKTSLPAIVALLISLPAGAEIYKHVDTNGTVVFTNRSETVPADRRSRWSPDHVQGFSRTQSAERARRRGRYPRALRAQRQPDARERAPQRRRRRPVLRGLWLLGDLAALGKARVADVPATINPHLPVGLLGAAYLNHFVYSVDPASGELVLSRRDA
jgi:hypothetical protein